ncbi:MAG: DUF3048 domain-containing protein [Ruthenibacterium sp.]
MKKLLAIALILVMTLTMATACGKKPDTTSSSAPASVSVPEEPVIPYEPNVLTGEKAEIYPQTKRFAALMVNNISGSAKQNARPQWGIGEADVLVEIMVEGGITRFMALFSDYTKIPKIGPIRSARDQFFQLVLPFQPLYIHIGESVVQGEYRKNYAYDDLDINLDHYTFKRDEARQAEGRASEHTAYTEAEQLEGIIDADKDANRTYTSTFFNFVNYDEPERALTGDKDGANAAAYKIDIKHSEGYRTYFTYDAAESKYMMSQYSLAKGGVHDTVDANNDQQLSFKNVLVLFTDIHVYPGHEVKDLQQVDLTSGGVGYYFCNGQAEAIRWVKGSPQGVLRILDKFGNETDVPINPGKTYLSVVDLDMATAFTYYATEAAANGTEEVTVDPNAASTTVTDE